MTHVSLFSGIGGFDLAAEWAGFETILQVERDPYCRAVLAKRWPNVRRLEDVKDVTRESVNGPVDVLSGGFPCQPFSVAGKQRGTEDDRYLWPVMLAAIQQTRPRFVVAENVPGLIAHGGGMVFEIVCADLEAEGYEVQPVLAPACGVGAWHRRERVFIVAHRASERTESGRLSVRPRRPHEAAPYVERRCEDAADAQRSGIRQQSEPEPERSGAAVAVVDRQDVTDSTQCGCGQKHQDGSRTSKGATTAQEWRRSSYRGGWSTEPDVGRVAYGVPNRVDRLRALGNAVVPQQAYPIFAAICAVIEGQS